MASSEINVVSTVHQGGRGRHTLNLQSGGLYLSTRIIDDTVISDHCNNPENCRISNLQQIFKDTTGNVLATNKPFVVVNQAGKPLPYNHKNQILGSVRPHQFVHCLEDSLRRNPGRAGKKTLDSSRKQISPTRRYLLSNMRYMGRSESRSTGRDKNAVGVVIVGGECNMFTDLATPDGVPRNAAELGLAVGDPLFLTLPQCNSDGTYKSNEFMFTPQNPLADAANWTRAAISPLSRLVLDHVEGILAGLGLDAHSLHLSHDETAAIIKEKYAQAVQLARCFGDWNDVIFEKAGTEDASDDLTAEEAIPQTRDDLSVCLVDEVLRKIERIAQLDAVQHVGTQPITIGDEIAKTYGIPTSYVTARELVQHATFLAFSDRVTLQAFAEALVNLAADQLNKLDKVLGIVRQLQRMEPVSHNALRVEALVSFATLGKIPEFDALYSIHKKSADIVRADLRQNQRTAINDLFVGLFMGQLDDGSVKLLQARAG